MKKGWVGYDNTARELKDIYVGVNSTARKCVAAYVGIGNRARKIYPIIPIPTLSGTYEYTGQPQTVTIDNLDEDNVSVSGNTATNRGTYTVTFSLTDPFAVWEDGTSTNKTAQWIIEAGKLSVPAVSPPSAAHYSGRNKNAVISAYDSNKIRAGGTTEARNVGKYTVTFDLIDSNYTWEDGTTGQKTATWNILKATFHAEYGTYGRIYAYERFYDSYKTVTVHLYDLVNEDNESLDLWEGKSGGISFSFSWSISGDISSSGTNSTMSYSVDTSVSASTISVTVSLAGTSCFNAFSCSESNIRVMYS